MRYLGAVIVYIYCRCALSDLHTLLHVRDLIALSYFSPNIWHPKPPPKTIHPSTEVLSTIIEGPEHPAFSDIPEVKLHQPTNNISTTAAGSSQNDGGTSSTQTNGGAPYQSPMWASSPLQVILGDVELEQVQLQDQEEEASEDEVAEEELFRVYQEIERLCQE
jgi:hypothetical protein